MAAELKKHGKTAEHRPAAAGFDQMRLRAFLSCNDAEYP